jgi:putative phage-type endonuclease
MTETITTELMTTELMTTELIDITDKIVPDKDSNFFNEEESLEIYQTCIYLMEEFIKDNPKLISEPDFNDIFDENIEELMHSHFDSDIFYTEEAEEEMEEIIEHSKNDFFKDQMPPRSYPDTIILEEPDHEFVKEQLDILRNKPQPTQRTKEWYEFRHNLITASNAYKAFESQTVKNQLIYEKCQPLNQGLYIDNDNSDDELSINETKQVTIKEVVMVNINTTLHWGQKYEPLSVKIYQYLYDTKVEDFGCIQHETYMFLGASPDGINVDPESKRYGRMLEIKNIVNREIDGIPKKEYWIQMQLQMEVCDLDECDFLETKFTEYPNFISYNDDTLNEWYEDENGNELLNPCLSKDNKMKGQLIYFHTKEGTPFYLYKPLDIIHPDDITAWQEDTVDYYQHTPEFKYTYIKTIYWKLEHISCVLVCRNRQWFKDNIDDLQELWSIVEKERISGYEHRAPNRKQKKSNVIDFTTKPSGGCLLQFNKESGKITVVKREIENTTSIPDLIINTSIPNTEYSHL